MRKVTNPILLTAALLLTGTPGFANGQVTPPAGGQRQRLELEQRLQRGFFRQIQTQLQLDQAQVASLQSVTRSFQQERMTLNRAQATLRHKLRTPGLVDLPEEEARALLQEMVTLQEQELDLYRREQAEFLKLVTPVQLIRFYRLREDLGQRVQQLRQGRGQGGGRGGGVGGLGMPNGTWTPGGR
jgi:hypothetical protein